MPTDARVDEFLLSVNYTVPKYGRLNCHVQYETNNIIHTDITYGVMKSENKGATSNTHAKGWRAVHILLALGIKLINLLDRALGTIAKLGRNYITARLKLISSSLFHTSC